MANPWDNDPIVPKAQQTAAVKANPWDADPIVSPESMAPIGSGMGASDLGKVDTSGDVNAVRARIAALPEQHQPAALRKWAKEYVAKERANGGTMQSISDFVRNVARGSPVGSWLDEANAGTSAALHAVTGGYAGAPYDEALAYQRETDKAIDADSKKLGSIKVPIVGDVDVTTGGLQKLGGGVASAVAAPMVNLVRGTTILPRIINQAATGGVYGGIYGSGEGETAGERIKSGVIGSAAGTALGAVAEPVVTGVGNLANATANQFRRTPQGVRGYDRGAVDRVARAAEDDNLAARYPREAANLGEEGMLADMGDRLRSQAGTLANRPGPEKTVVARALEERHSGRDPSGQQVAPGAAGRITADVDQALGPAANIPETIEATRQHYRQAAEPYRQAFESGPVPFTAALEQNLAHIVENHPNILRDAQRLAADAQFAGLNQTPQQFFARQLPNGQYEITRVPNAVEWDAIKKAFDNMAHSPGASRTDQTLYGNAARRIREAVDQALSPGSPGQSPYAQARGLEAENFRIADAVEAGQGAFAKSNTPDQMRAEMFGVGGRGGMTPPELAGYALGGREHVRNVMGNASTQWGENAATAARSSLGSGHAREKLELVAGPQAAENLIRRLEAETTFAKTRQDVLMNSKTADRMQGGHEFPKAGGADAANELAKTSITGQALKYGYRLANALLGGALEERRVRTALDAANMLVAQGARRDEIARGLFQYAQQNQVSQARRDLLVRLARTIATGPRQQAIDAATR